MVNRYNQRKRETDILFELAVIFSLFVALGFPGKLEDLYGESLGKAMEYGAFALEITVLMLSSGGSWQDIELIHFDKKYAAMYLFVFSCFGISMLVTYDSRLQLITCLRLVVTLLFAIWLQEKYRLTEILEMFCISQGAFVFATLAFIVIYPQYAFSDAEGQSHALVGLYQTKNACGTELDFGIVMTVLLLHEKRKARRPEMKWWLLLFVQLILLFLCEATGALITVAFAILSIYLFQYARFPLGLIYITVNVVFLFCMLAFMPMFEDMLIAMGKDATLTGRIPIWRRVIEVMTANKTMTGYGYGMFWRDPSALISFQTGFSMRKNPFMATLTTGAHNVFLEMWLNSGLLGLAAFFFMVLFSFRDMHALSDEQYRLCLGVMGFLMINGLTERCLGGNYDYKVLASFLAMAIGCNAAGSRKRTLMGVRPIGQAQQEEKGGAYGAGRADPKNE